MMPDKASEPNHTLGLEMMTNAVRYRGYLRELLQPHCGRTILEVGSGLGDLAAELRGYDRLVVTDVDPGCLDRLRKRFDGRVDVEVIPFDLRHPPPDHQPVETVLAVNVLEHIVDDRGALRAMVQIAQPGGNIVLFVPAYPSLFGSHDRAAGHVRRYVPRTLRAAVSDAGLAVEVLRPVNFLGGIAWWVAVRVGGCSSPRRGLVGLYDRIMIPLVRLTERRWSPPFGQSILCVARVPKEVDAGSTARPDV